MQDQLGQLDVLNAQVERFGGSDAAECVIDGRIGLKPSMKDEALATWMKNAIDRMDAAITESTRMEIMEACGKNCSEMNRRVIEAGLARRRKYKTEEAFLDAEVKTPKASVHIERGDGVIYQVYAPRGFGKGLRCFCSLTRGLPDAELMSPTYCICSEAFARNYWRSPWATRQGQAYRVGAYRFRRVSLRDMPIGNLRPRARGAHIRGLYRPPRGDVTD